MNTKEFLFRYEIVHSSDFGRYLIASQDIPEKSLILIEEPSLVAPADEVGDSLAGQQPLCLGCFAPISSEDICNDTLLSSRCTSCRWPLCTLNCEQMSTHRANECKIFTENNVTFPPPYCWPILNKTILVLRCLLLKTKNYIAWKEFIGKLEHHSEVRSEKTGCYKGDEMILKNFQYFYESCGKCPFTEEEIKAVSGVINVNAFCAIKTDSISGVTRRAKCLFEKASLLAHSCSPNCSWDISIDYTNNHKINSNDISFNSPPLILIRVATAVPIAKGDMLTIFYSTRYALFGTLKRIVSMEEIAHFICKCSRCKDPTELGSFVSAVKCFNCESEYLLPEEPTEPESQWKCQDASCERKYNVSKIVYMVCKVEDHVEKIRSLNLTPVDEVGKLNDLFKKYSHELLHRNHYVLQEVSTRILHVLFEDMNILCQEKTSSSEINVPLVELFIYHCKYLLETAVILLPAMTGYVETLELYLEHAERIRRKNI